MYGQQYNPPSVSKSVPRGSHNSFVKTESNGSFKLTQAAIPRKSRVASEDSQDATHDIGQGVIFDSDED